MGVSDNINVGGTENLFYGNVGIGTSTPDGASSYTLAVYGTTNITGNLELGVTDAGVTTLFTGLSTPATISTSANNWLGVYFASTTNAIITIRSVKYEVISQ